MRPDVRFRRHSGALRAGRRRTGRRHGGNAKADVVIAPQYSEAALALFAAKRKNMRVLSAPAPGSDRWHVRQVSGGWLVQDPYRLASGPAEWRVVTANKPSDENWTDLQLAWRVCAAVKSNAIVLTANGMAVGIGGGQQNRVSPGELAGGARRRTGEGRGGRQRCLLSFQGRARHRRRFRSQLAWSNPAARFATRR